jgi:hypothetical protein
MPIKLKSSGGGDVTLDVPSTASTYTLTIPAISGNVIASTAVSSSTTNTVTNKIAININGTVYYLLASTSGT